MSMSTDLNNDINKEVLLPLAQDIVSKSQERQPGRKRCFRHTEQTPRRRLEGTNENSGSASRRSRMRRSTFSKQ